MAGCLELRRLCDTCFTGASRFGCLSRSRFLAIAVRKGKTTDDFVLFE